MRIVFSVIAFGCVILTSPTLAFAQSTSQGAPATAQPQDPNEVVCETQKVTGSRLSKRRVCMTRAQWADQILQEQQALEKVQRSGRVIQSGD